ncbi:hypothetical protein PMIN07_012574, partial [Paraphaeosphaeria minitans]
RVRTRDSRYRRKWPSSIVSSGNATLEISARRIPKGRLQSLGNVRASNLHFSPFAPAAGCCSGSRTFPLSVLDLFKSFDITYPV